MKKILIIDDSALMRTVLSDIINADSRFQVVDKAKDGVEGLELLKKNTYDAVVLDINMPRMDGITMLKEVQKNKIRAKIMMASTDTKEGAKVTMDACIEYDNHEYLYFFAKEDGTVIYSKTLDEHNAAVEKYQWY